MSTPIHVELQPIRPPPISVLNAICNSHPSILPQIYQIQALCACSACLHDVGMSGEPPDCGWGSLLDSADDGWGLLPARAEQASALPGAEELCEEWGALSCLSEWAELAPVGGYPDFAGDAVVLGGGEDAVLLEAEGVVHQRGRHRKAASAGAALRPLLSALNELDLAADALADGGGDLLDAVADGSETPLALGALEFPADADLVPESDDEPHGPVAADPLHDHDGDVSPDPVAELVLLSPAMLQRACGFGVLDHVLATALLCCERGAMLDGLYDGDSQHVAHSLMLPAARAVVSDTAAAESLNVTRKKFRCTKHRLACAAVLCQRTMVKLMMEGCVRAVTAAGGKCLVLSEFPRYDETPMVSRIKAAEVVYDFLHRKALTNGSSDWYWHSEPYLAGPQKLLATQCKYVMLFKIGEKFVSVEWEILVPVQILARGTGETYARALQTSLLDLAPFQRDFSRVQRVATTDGDAAVARCERYVSFMRPLSHCLHLRCIVHRVATAKEATVQVQKSLVQEITHAVLSLRASRGIVGFRAAVKKLVMNKLVIDRTSAPDPALQARQQALLNVFLPPHEAEHRMKRAVILALAHDDWADSRVLVYHALHSPLSDSAIKAAFAGPFISALVGTGPTSFPSRNWVGAEQAPSWFGVLAIIKGLLMDAYCLWADSLAPRHKKRGDDLDVEDAALPMLEDGDPGGHSAGVDVPNGDAPEEAAPGNTGRRDAEQERRDNAKHRATGVKWLSSCRPVATELLCFRLALEPHKRWMGGHLHMAGKAWMQKQMAAEYNHMKQLLPGAEPGSRCCRLLHAFEGGLEQRFLDHIDATLAAAATWNLVPGHARTRKLQHELFIMFARSKCRGQRIKWIHKGYPYILFGLLGSRPDAVLRQIKGHDKCLRDPWSQSIVEHYADELGSEECIADLEATGFAATEETVPIEAGHASLRRVLVARSVQAKRLDMEGLNSDKVLREMRTEAAEAQKLRRAGEGQRFDDAVRQDGAGRPEDAAEQTSAKKRAWSSWTSFVSNEHEQGRHEGGCLDFASLSAVYNSLSADKLRELQEDADATNRGLSNHGRLPGKRQKTLERERMKDDVAAELGFSSGGGHAGARRSADGSAPTAPIPDSGLSPPDVSLAVIRPTSWQEIRRARVAMQLLREQDHQKLESDVKALHEFSQGDTFGKSVLAIASKVIPADQIADTVPLPAARPSIQRMRWAAPGLQAKANKLASLDARPRASKKLLGAFDRCWRNYNCAVEPDTWVEEPTSRLSKCYTIGLCVCRGSGKNLRRIADAFSKPLRTACRFSTFDKECLTNGRVVALLFGDREWGGRERAADVLPGEYETKWVHLSDHSFKPWESLFTLLYPVSPMEIELEEGALVVDDFVELQSSGVERTYYEFLAGVDQQLRWHVVFFHFRDTCELLGEIRPDRCQVVPAAGAAFHLVWDPDNESAKHGRKLDKDGWGDFGGFLCGRRCWRCRSSM